MNGTGKILDKIFLLLVFMFSCFFLFGNDLKPYLIEQKAVRYFCENVKDINKNLIDFNIRFNGKTLGGKPSSVFIIADCLGDISLMIDSIPHKNELDSISEYNKNKLHPTISIGYPEKCDFLRKYVFAPFNKWIYTLYVFNAIEYNGTYHVELYLVNKIRNSWSVVVVFDESNNPVNHCISFLAF